MNRLRWIWMALALCSSFATAGHSPENVAFSPDGKWLAVADRTGGRLLWMDAAERKVAGSVTLEGKPAGLAWRGDKIYVAQYDAGSVSEVDPAAGKVKRRLAVGPKPSGLAVATGKGLLLTTDFGLDCIVVTDLTTGKERKRIPTLSQPWSIAVAPDESLAAVGHLTPAGDATRSNQAAAITLLDLNTLEKVAEILLPAGSTNVRGITFSPDGRWIYVVHTLGHFSLPTTQLDRGWVNTNMLTILAAGQRKHHATILLDQVTHGAANPWGIALSGDGQNAWITLAGAQEVVCVNLAALHAYLGDGTKDPAKRTELQYDFSALYTAGMIVRHHLPGNGPRGVAISPDGKQVAMAAYFTDELLLLDVHTPLSIVRVPLGTTDAPNAARRGELAFHDATLCYQAWLSCATCHPDGRADGLNWDLPNDGIGNPKNTKSLVWAHKTPPVMWMGVRGSMDEAVEKGFHFMLFSEVSAQTLQDVREYLRSLAPEPSPYLVDGKLSVRAEKGRALFDSVEKTGCASCHPAPLFTDLHLHEVGTRHELDRDAKPFVTPTLVELWRTPPFLHDGSAQTLEELLTRFNCNDQHGVISKLSQDEMTNLVEYLLSL